ncbi:hypothetical protein R3P38DRAFT_3059975 [Favolaschia claudopus]|uniref:F-box domain-containing protein n=1 Tax=Favolaschia claudopus TaxID=2862362 RepID=A0AAW0A2Q7_9AGAR
MVPRNSRVLSLPNETLAEIFHQYVHLDDSDIVYYGGGPWVLSSVCHSWRYVALAHPTLWSFIRVENLHYLCGDVGRLLTSSASYDDENTCGILHLLNLALQRSKARPLHVRMNVSTVDHSRLLEYIIRAIVAHCDRWKTADLTITREITSLFAPISTHLSLLSELTLSSFEDFPQQFPYAAIAPSLTRVTLKGFRHTIVPLPWPSVRHFAEQHIWQSPIAATNSFLTLLQLNAQLESLDLAYDCPYPSAKSPLTHQSLRRLATSEPDIIRSLTLPQLEELVIENRKGILPAVRSLLRRSECSLRSLHLVDFAFSQNTIALLSLCNNTLRSLIVRLTDFEPDDKESMEKLVQKLAEPFFLPSLEALAIVIFRDYHSEDSNFMERPCDLSFIDDTFVDILADRWRRRLVEGQAHLKRAFVLVDLPSAVTLSQTHRDHLRQMCDEGLDVTITARDPEGLDLSKDAKDISYVYDEVHVYEYRLLGGYVLVNELD